MADARGFGDSIQIPILAKLMLAEYYFSDKYKEIAALTDDYGKCPLLTEFEKQLSTTDPLLKIEDESEHGAVVISTPRDKQMQETPKRISILKNGKKIRLFQNGLQVHLC